MTDGYTAIIFTRGVTLSGLQESPLSCQAPRYSCLNIKNAYSPSDSESDSMNRVGGVSKLQAAPTDHWIIILSAIAASDDNHLQ